MTTIKVELEIRIQDSNVEMDHRELEEWVRFHLHDSASISMNNKYEEEFGEPSCSIITLDIY